MDEDMFRPPVNRAMKVLDRSFFHKTFELSAARINHSQDISKCRSELQRSKDALLLERFGNIRPDPADPARKCILLRPQTDQYGSSRPWTPTVAELQTRRLINIIPYPVTLDYDYWTYHDIAAAILPQDNDGEVPSAFTMVGHVAHLNLREKHAPFKGIIGQVLLDKNPHVRTVINKTDDVGEESQYRTFSYEVLAGPDDMQVQLREADCIFHFDYSKVYYNSRLSTEHERLVKSFEPGQAVCDVMAGIGPFAVPAGKRKVFVSANDLNPDGYSSLVDAISRNKVDDYVRAFNQDGRDFIRSATVDLLRTEKTVVLRQKISRTQRDRTGPPTSDQTLTRPKVFSHYIMNLPATATTFLSSFIGLFAQDRSILPVSCQMPMIHVYCFSTKSDDNAAEAVKICDDICRQLNTTEITPATPELSIHDVRDVAPNKRMFCASFRLPEEVAFRSS